MIEHHIALIVSDEIDKNHLRAWFHAVRDNAPQGVVVTVTVDGKPVQIVKSKEKDVRYMVPLSRDLTDAETKTVIDAFSHNTDMDFSVSSTTSPLDMKLTPEIEIDHDPMVELCTGWAKKKHEDWMSTKTGSGWRYGPTVSNSNKTHPLLRQWSELPAEYRKVDTSQAQAMLDLLRDSGYIIVRREDLDKLLGDGGL
jgi:hypothetical protein